MKDIKYYQVPKENWVPLHFVRPRFKSNIENVLLYMANECCKIDDCSCKEYSKKYLNAIKMFPGNQGMSVKTLNNWRTEIPALFSFYVEDKANDITHTSKMAFFLHENQDLTQFLRLFLLSFQFPGGHLKSAELVDLILHGIKFKPAKTIIQVLLEGNKILSSSNKDKEMSLSAEETAYCIFNDDRVTSGERSSQFVAQTILDNRESHIKYYNKEDEKIFSSKGVAKSKGDVIRYAGDILDYMTLANLLEKHNGYYYLKGNEIQAINLFASDNSWFSGYDKFYSKEVIEISELSNIESEWFEYVNDSMRPSLFKTDIRTILGNDTELDVVVEGRIKDVVTSDDTTTKDIGNLGEAIICGHERMRLKINGYERLVKFVQIVDGSAYHPGYDIDSFEADGTDDHRYIEVKTTISKHEIQQYGFHMSPNEWSVANTIKEHYCVYRLMLSENSKILFILRNPVALYKKDKIEALPRNGMEVSFAANSFKPTKLLKWKQ